MLLKNNNFLLMFLSFFSNYLFDYKYYFYVQLVCPANAATDDCTKLVHELENVCRTVRILGVFDL